MSTNNADNISSSGITSYDGAGTFYGRTITAASSRVLVTNGDGVSGNPTVDVQENNLDPITLNSGDNITVTGSPVSLGGVASIALNAQVQQPNGSFGAPPYSFSSDPTSGIYWSPTFIGFAIGGSSFVRFGSASAVFDQSQIFMQSLQTGGGRVVNVQIKSADYVALTSDFFIGFDTSAARLLTLPGSPSTGQTYRVADVTGGMASNNVTVSGNGHNIDNAATFVMNVAYGSADFTYTGTIWKVS